MQGFRPRRHAATPCSPVLPKHTRPKQATHRLTPTDLGHTRQRLCVIQKASHKDVSVFVTHRASLSVPRARPRTARLCPWIVRACREIDGWIASVTKAAKIFCVRGCLRTGVQLCALSRRARVSAPLSRPHPRAGLGRHPVSRFLGGRPGD